MKVEDTGFPEVKLVRLDRFEDQRGVFAETYDANDFAAFGIAETFVQDSWSVSYGRGTIRGLHFHAPPRAQAKLVRVPRGRVFDVVVDIRHGSPNYGRHVSFDLDAKEMLQLYVPEGFAHGFCTLDDDTEITYKMSDHFSSDHYLGIAWDDPALGIAWPVSGSDAIVSDKDRGHPRLADLPALFTV